MRAYGKPPPTLRCRVCAGLLRNHRFCVRPSPASQVQRTRDRAPSERVPMSSRAQAPGQGRGGEWAETVMGERSDILSEECAQVIHAVFEHGDASDAHAPGKTLVF